MESYNLKNSFLEINVLEKGAELCSLYSTKTKLQYIWEANPEVWKRHAPILFPIVGALRNDTYYYNNVSFKLSQHGFARDKNFKLVEENSEHLVFCLTADQETINVYPFDFNLFVTYTLKGRELHVEYKVENINESVMYFSIGAHPAFRCPLIDGENYKDYYLEFENEESTNRYFLQNGLLSDMQSRVLENEKVIPLSHRKFDEDAIILKKLISSKITLKSGKSANGIIFEFPNFPYLGLWAKPGADFICIEPWFGIADHKNSKQKIEEKEGIQSLNPGQVFKCSYTIIPL